MKISGEAALVTGAASGLGAATARALRAADVRVAGLDIGLAGDGATSEAALLSLHCDVTDEESAKDAIFKAAEANGPARILVNCAGIVEARRVLSREGVMPLSHFRGIVDVHLVGTFNMVRLFAEATSKLPDLSEDGERGVIINTSSIAGLEGQVGAVSYASAKAGIAGMTLPLARELADFGIRVMAIAPGAFETPMAKSLRPEAQADMIGAVPFPKRFGRPQEFADLALHICQNDMLNGEVIRLDGALRIGFSA